MLKPAFPLVVSAFLALALISLPVAAQYPQKPVRLVVPYAPGGGTDSIARLLAEKLAGRLGQPVVVENKGGASGIIGSDAVAKSPADGYTLLLAGVGPLAVSPSLIQKARYQPTKDFVPIVKVSSAAMVLVTASKKPGEGLKELVEYARNKPGQLTVANAGDGSPQHICAAMFARSAGITVNHIAYKGAANAITDLLGGTVQVLCDNVGTVRPFIQAGKLRPLAVSTRKRAEALPDVPTFEAQGLHGIDFALWFMLVAPAGTPTEVVTRLNNEVNAILKQPDVIQKLHDNGSEPAGGPVTSANQFLAKENAAWLEMVRAIGLTKQ
ncbi:tripartite tricarboxylate transporter substrate binding protein [Cupriavidus taiwanensis]|uniref:Bug family tripartite tricarboxylate transporter substrate binding protein n=1 Tax=Cupriavidus taiwanensis TaxID=164546 RepID=UPI0025417943|nr:tripartite tricarboxylate transporter substrate binding protein [Cupriavidus taiwanensis]MDK3026429.1 tripartite tricarboxylate transporter substrate binding protein [Cupriavidus taiwanensis]